MPSVGILLIFRHYTSAITRNKSPPSFYIYSKWDANDGISEESEWRGTFCNVWTMRENVRSRKKMERNKCCLLILFLCQITGDFLCFVLHFLPTIRVPRKCNKRYVILTFVKKECKLERIQQQRRISCNRFCDNQFLLLLLLLASMKLFLISI